MPGLRVEGHCLCRAVVFEYDAEPNWTLYCHCESCRRATSSPITTWISVPRNAFRFKRGSPRYFSSSPSVRRGFCATRGSPLTYEAERIPDEIHLYAAALVDPTRVVPQRHVFVDEQLPWFETADELPRFARTSRGGAKPVRHGPKALSNSGTNSCPGNGHRREGTVRVVAGRFQPKANFHVL